MNPLLYFTFGLEKLNTAADQIGKIHISYLMQLSFVCFKHSLEGGVDLERLQVVGIGKSPVFCIADFSHDGVKFPFLVIRETRSEQTQRVIIIIDGEVGIKANF